MLATRWPLLKLLAGLQNSAAPDAANSCVNLWHPSIDWEEWRHQAPSTRACSDVTTFAEETPRWLDGHMEQPPAIAKWTNLCPLGVLSAFSVRAVSLVLGHNDVQLGMVRYRIVQRAIENAERTMKNLELWVEDVLQSSWPIFQPRGATARIRCGQASTEPSERSTIYHRARQSLTAAAHAATAKVVIMTGLYGQRVGHLLDLFKHADRLSYLAPLVPMLPNVTETCKTIAELYLQRLSGSPWGSTKWSPCLPFVSQFRGQHHGSSEAQELWKGLRYLYLHLALQLDLPVLWFDFHLVLLQNPFLWLPDALAGRLALPSYREPCQRYCHAQGEPDPWQRLSRPCANA
eukprot:Skav206195  [mRNA]  locus=scaffold1844:275377:281025:- [translate_table: standard]